MSYVVVKIDLYCWVSMLAIFFGSSSYLLATFKGPILLYIFCIYLHISKMLWDCFSLTELNRISNGHEKAKNDI